MHGSPHPLNWRCLLGGHLWCSQAVSTRARPMPCAQMSRLLGYTVVSPGCPAWLVSWAWREINLSQVRLLAIDAGQLSRGFLWRISMHHPGTTPAALLRAKLLG